MGASVMCRPCLATNQEVARSSRAGRTITLRIIPLANRSEQRERLVCFVDFWSIFAFPCRRWVHDGRPGGDRRESLAR